LLPPMIARKRGAILNVSSSAGFLPMSSLAVYAASKSYVTSFSEAIRMELRRTGVSVTTLCPGPVHTEFTEVAKRQTNRKQKSGPEFVHVSVEDTVSAALNALTQDRALVIPGLVMKLAMGLVRLTPLPVLRFASRFSAKD
jgi:short-subunit dehydrogenase